VGMVEAEKWLKNIYQRGNIEHLKMRLGLNATLQGYKNANRNGRLLFLRII